jgi:hypothetical protein
MSHCEARQDVDSGHMNPVHSDHRLDDLVERCFEALGVDPARHHPFRRARLRRGLEVRLHGDLARILELCEAGARRRERPGRGGPGRGLSVVAGAGFEPATFRL